jgi:uncharacterized protein YbaP (TraB family)
LDIRSNHEHFYQEFNTENLAVVSIKPIRDMVRNTSKSASVLIILLLALTSISGGACLADESMPFDEGLLWRVTASDDRTSYVLGFSWSLHPDLAEPSTEILEAFHQSEILVLQCPMSEEAQEKWGEIARENDGMLLPWFLGTDLYRRVKAALNRYWASNLIVGQFGPVGIAMVLQSTPDDWVRLNRNELTLAARLHNRALRRGIPIIELQSVDDQASYIKNINDKAIKSVILEVLERNYWIEEYDKLFRELYIKEDIASLYSIITTSKPDFEPSVLGNLTREDIRDTTIRIWPGLLDSLKSDRAFVAVEFQLLPGTDGLLNRLVQHDFRVERVR